VREKIFYSISFGFIFGVLIRSFVFVNFYIALFLGALAIGLFLFFTFVSRNRWGIVTSVFLIALSLGILRFDARDTFASAFFENQVGKEVSFVGTIIDEPDERQENQKLNIKIKQEKEEVEILATLDFSERYLYGDEVKVEGVLERSENFLTDQGKVFDYINYLRKDRIEFVMYYPEVRILSRGGGSAIRRALFSVKNAFLEHIDANIKVPESLLLGGLILGERGAFSEELRQQFIDTGTIHIVALSGYNVTIVAEWFIKFFEFLPGVMSIWAGILAIFLFVLMTGAPATAVRAGVMAVLALIARATGRNYDVARALILAGVLMVIINPMILRYDASFQLSFIATVAVIFLAPKFMKYFQWVPKSFGLRDVVAVTCAAYIFVLPMILYKMGNLSLTALPANILILPFIPATMLLGFFTGLAGIVWYALAVPFGFLSSILLGYELWVVDILSSFSFSSFTIPNFPLILTLAIYAYFIYRLFGRNIKKFFRFEE